MSKRFTEDEMLSLARRAVRKVDRFGPRGVTLVTMQEIEAMAVALVCFGLSPNTRFPEEGARS